MNGDICTYFCREFVNIEDLFNLYCTSKLWNEIVKKSCIYRLEELIDTIIFDYRIIKNKALISYLLMNNTDVSKIIVLNFLIQKTNLLITFPLSLFNYAYMQCKAQDTFKSRDIYELIFKIRFFLQHNIYYESDETITKFENLVIDQISHPTEILKECFTLLLPKQKYNLSYILTKHSLN